jgi:hypothetical protein
MDRNFKRIFGRVPAWSVRKIYRPSSAPPVPFPALLAGPFQPPGLGAPEERFWSVRSMGDGRSWSQPLADQPVRAAANNISQSFRPPPHLHGDIARRVAHFQHAVKVKTDELCQMCQPEEAGAVEVQHAASLLPAGDALVQDIRKEDGPWQKNRCATKAALSLAAGPMHASRRTAGSRSCVGLMAVFAGVERLYRHCRSCADGWAALYPYTAYRPRVASAHTCRAAAVAKWRVKFLYTSHCNHTVFRLTLRLRAAVGRSPPPTSPGARRESPPYARLWRGRRA